MPMMLRFSATIGVFLPGMLAAPLAFAQDGKYSSNDTVPQPTTVDPSTVQSEHRVEAKRWYGWQTLSTDGVAIASFVIAGATNEANVLPAVGLGTYLFGGPIVHATHGNWGRSAASLGMRTAIPVATGALVYAVNNCESPSNEDAGTDGWCELGRAVGALFGGMVGATVAVALDASLLAWEHEEPRPQFAPALGVTKTSAWLGVAGQF